jgi:hypothetical protein
MLGFQGPAQPSPALSNSRQMITLGFIATTSVRQFAVDLRQMLDLGIPTFETAPEAFEAVP